MKSNKITCKKESTRSQIIVESALPVLQQLQSDFEGFAQEYSL